MKTSTPTGTCRASFVWFILLSVHAAALAQDGSEQPDRGWSATAELTGVWTAGNAAASTFGLNAAIRRVWPMASLKFEGGGIRTETVRISRRANGTADDFDIVEESDRERTAESYYARGRFDRQLSSVFYAFGGLDWLRNTFAGIASRSVVSAGAGNLWIKSERTQFKTDYGLTYTVQDDVVEDPTRSSNFAGLRAAVDLWQFVSSSAEFTSVLVADWNLENTDDLRLDWTTSLPVSISAGMALKPSLQLLWRNDPSLTEVPLTNPDGTAAGQFVTAPLEKLDTFFTLALVVKI